RRRVVAAALVVTVAAGLVVAAVWGARQVYFLGSDPSGRLALYRGLPYDLPLGINLYSEVYAAPVQVSDLSSSARSSATNHELRSKDDATSLVKDLTARARAPTPPAPLPTLPKPKPKPTTQKNARGGKQQAAGSKQTGGSTTGGKASGGG